ncbi:MAG: serine/threonine protein kinase [Planctomycetia bacterium]|nr:serine/threonine protein kinase [Planctomycetia bacterium]
MTLDTSAPPTQLGNYEIVLKIADGGMGTVYKARNRTTGEIVAIKVIAPATAKNPVLLQRFEREFLAARVLEHPNVVRAIEYCGIMPHPFLVMEFVDGQSIGQRIEQLGAYPEAEAVRIIAQVCDGLQRAHKQGLIHRDVKPDNILVTPTGIAKLTDMGLVKELDGDLNLTKTGRGLGTPHYMAPEQFRNAKGVDVRGDIYSLGATLYAMVTGVIPFDNASPLDCWMRKIRNEFPAPKELKTGLSDRVDWAIRRAMSAEPERRPTSCREFLEDLTGQSRAAPAPGPGTATPANATDVWYLVYRDENNTPHTVKGSTDGIRKALRERLLGDPSEVLVSRTKNGQFIPLQSVPEFRDLVVSPAAMQLPGPRPNEETAPYPTSPPVQPASGVMNNRNRPTAPNSGKFAPPPLPSSKTTPAPPPRPQPPTPQITGQTGETIMYNYGATPVSQPTPQPASKPHAPARTNRPDRDEDEKPLELPRKFDWTPVLIVLVMLLSAAVGYLWFTR